MEVERRFSSRLKRKPLLDCTNTPQILSNLPKKIPNFTHFTKNLTLNNKNYNPNFNFTLVNYNDNIPVKSHTSTGSNNSPNSVDVISQPHALISRAGDISCWESGPSATQIQSQDQRNRKYKGKSVIDANGSHTNKTPGAENYNVDELHKKDKGKLFVETSIIQVSPSFTSHTLQTSSSAASGNCFIPGPSAVHSHKKDGHSKKNNEKTKMKGVELNDGGSDGHPGSHTDPHPVYKKRFHIKKDDSLHGLPQDEVDKLKAYYADLDAFELPEEIASDGEME